MHICSLFCLVELDSQLIYDYGLSVHHKLALDEPLYLLFKTAHEVLIKAHCELEGLFHVFKSIGLGLLTLFKLKRFDLCHLGFELFIYFVNILGLLEGDICRIIARWRLLITSCIVDRAGLQGILCGTNRITTFMTLLVFDISYIEIACVIERFGGLIWVVSSMISGIYYYYSISSVMVICR